MATKNSISSNIPIEISKGGTNTTSLSTNYGTLYYDTSGISTVASAGTSGQILKSNGSSSAPTFQDAGSASLSVAFLANLTTDITNVTGDDTLYTVVWDNEVYDLGSDFNTTTGVFTAPSTAKYCLISCVNIFGTTSNNAYEEFISTSNRDYIYTGNLRYERSTLGSGSFDDSVAKILAVLADMDAADTAVSKVKSYGSTADNDILATSASYFCGYQTP